MRSILGIFAALSISIMAADAHALENVRIGGDPCSNPLIADLAKAYTMKNRDFKAEISSMSCTLGVYKAASGEFDIGVSTQNGLSANLPKGAVNKVIASSPIVLIVNKANPVDNLTFKQLEGILSGKIRNWKEVGGKDSEIKNVMLEPCVRHTISKQVILYADDIAQLKPEKKVNPVEFTNMLVAGNENAIGQQIYGYESKDVKVLTIDGVLPDETTLSKKAYTFYQDYNVVTKGEPKGAVADFIRFTMSEEARDIMKGLKHVPR